MKNTVEIGYTLLGKLMQKEDLTQQECEAMAKAMLNGLWSNEVMAAVLTALVMKGETADELYAFASYMRSQAIAVHNDSAKILDTCGTGGDGSHLFNVSTASALVLASTGCIVAKHGNAAVSSQSGSADVLQSLGVNLAMSASNMETLLEQTNIAFLFAPKLHPVMKHIMPVRKALKMRTIFNLLGPLCNPAKPTHQVIGVNNPKWLMPFAEVLKRLGTCKVMIVCSQDGLDEVSIAAKTDVVLLNAKAEITSFTFDPKEYGLDSPSLDALKVDSPQESAKLIQDALAGKGSRDVINMISVNAGFAYSLYYDKPLQESFQEIQNILASGKAITTLEKLANLSQSLAQESI